MKTKIIKSLFAILVIAILFNIEVSVAEESEIMQVPDYVEIGDILYMNFNNSRLLRNGKSIKDHIAIYIGENQFVHAKPFSKVEIRDYDYFLNNYKFHQFGYIVTANISHKQKAADWAREQVGKRYQKILKVSAKGTDNKWYNSELIWGAYNKQGIDIDADNDKNHNIVSINEIFFHNNTETYVIHKLPSYLQKGDIILMDLHEDNIWNIDGYSNDHAGLYMGQDFRDGSYIIHASGYGVSYTTYDLYHYHFCNFTFFRVNNANESQRNKAIEWAVNHLGYKYQYFFPESLYRGMWEFGLKCEDTTNTEVKTADRFYCMELVWAAYYNQGIDIDNNGWEEIYPKAPSQLGILSKIWDLVEGILFKPFAYVEGNDIINSQNTTQYLI